MLSKLLLISLATTHAQPISRQVLDLSKSTEIHMAPGRVSVVHFPEPIAEAKVGAPNKVKIVPSTTEPRELTLFWIEGRAYRTNLIVRTTKRIFVFDIVPVTTGHQDLLEIRGSFGSPSSGRVVSETRLAPVVPRSSGKTVSSGSIE